VYRYKRIAVKIGSNVLTQSDGTLNVLRMEALVSQIATLHENGVEVVLVSSGAVASGRAVYATRSELHAQKKLDTVSQRQLFSAIGQTKLINHYYELFAQHNIMCGQVLTTKENFSSRRHYLNQRNCMTVMIEAGVIPIVNENDTVSVTELMFTDNDELAGLIASMMSCEALVILSNIDGIYNGNPNSPHAHIIATISNEQQGIDSYIQSGHSVFGRGGMLTKYHIARKVAEEGIAVFSANGQRDNILSSLLSHTNQQPRTHFIPSPRSASTVKKWIAHSDGFAKGEIHINEGCRKALLSGKATSLLPIGITHITGNFEKDDITRIIDHAETTIGVGRTRYDSERLKELIGKKGTRPVVHYDYLYLE
jgi:glutamate 5-kinase